ncbi:MAG TPA: YIP1 family protein, partial [Pirellulaceae bacterium]|nr:YIP1 family protein [Pirellulaceae bacterium]
AAPPPPPVPPESSFAWPPGAGPAPAATPAPSTPPEPKNPFSSVNLPAGSAPPPKPANPFGERQAGSPFGGPATGSLNPYASPASAGYQQPTWARTGLPWENEKKTLGCWFRTFGIILGSPSRAFSIMRQTGGLGAPILYNMLGLGMPLALIGMIVVLISLVIMIAGVAGGNGANDAAAAIGIGLGMMGATALFLLVYVVLAATIGNFIAAGFWHLSLMLCGGARQGYETTFRVTGFTYGSLVWLAFIPYVGGFAMMIWLIVLLIIGLSKAHEIPSGKAALAVLLPFGLCCGAYIAFIVLMISGAILSAPAR